VLNVQQQDLQQTVDFIIELDKLKAVTRKVRPLGLDRYENSAEHSWQIAIFASALLPYAEGEVDINRVIPMLLVHDIGEIDTGDTMVFVEFGWEERKVAEQAAVRRIFAFLPDGRGDAFLELWREFEDGFTADSRFAHAVDRAMPVLLNLSNNGQSWRENGIGYDRVVRRIGPEINAGCPALWEYIEARLQQARSEGWFGASGH
jgi:putative hydrolase of HD superfamily